eukprot:m.423970 g.423970  ORF g.423970 m.423970 type:complete len:390 (+) comp56668_c0_seq6:163-1332(+)
MTQTGASNIKKRGKDKGKRRANSLLRHVQVARIRDRVFVCGLAHAISEVLGRLVQRIVAVGLSLERRLIVEASRVVLGLVVIHVGLVGRRRGGPTLVGTAIHGILKSHNGASSRRLRAGLGLSLRAHDQDDHNQNQNHNTGSSTSRDGNHGRAARRLRGVCGCRLRAQDQDLLLDGLAERGKHKAAKSKLRRSAHSDLIQRSSGLRQLQCVINGVLIVVRHVRLILGKQRVERGDGHLRDREDGNMVIVGARGIAGATGQVRGNFDGRRLDRQQSRQIPVEGVLEGGHVCDCGGEHVALPNGQTRGSAAGLVDVQIAPAVSANCKRRCRCATGQQVGQFCVRCSHKRLIDTRDCIQLHLQQNPSKILRRERGRCSANSGDSVVEESGEV